MKIVEITDVTDLMAGLADRHRAARPRVADNAARRAQYYSAKEARQRSDAPQARCGGPLCGKKVDEVRFTGASVQFCSRNCMESYYDLRAKK